MNYYLQSLILIFIYMNLWFVLALKTRDNSIVDIGWGIGFIIVALYNLLTVSEQSVRQVLVTILIVLWGVRLSAYIFSRNKGKAEDFRYAQWRKHWGSRWLLRSYLQVFVLQGLFMFLISYPVVLLRDPRKIGLNWLDYLGILVWASGFIIESLADAQKGRFKKIPANKGKVMRKGLWGISRHPNYFGESLMWWGVFLITCKVANGSLAIFSPVIITILITSVSGIPLIEKHHKDNPEYQEYVRTTSAFIPWFKKNSKA